MLPRTVPSLGVYCSWCSLQTHNLPALDLTSEATYPTPEAEKGLGVRK